MGIDIVKSWAPEENFRTVAAKASFILEDITLQKRFAGEIPIEGLDCKIGLIVGRSGTGKTSGINVDSAEDDKPIVEVQDANLGVSQRFDSAKFKPEKAQERVQKRTHKDCPVCTRIKEVGLLTAAQRLYTQYGADVLEVIEGHQLPSTKDADEKAVRKKDDLIGNVIQANKAAIENLRPLLAIFGVS